MKANPSCDARGRSGFQPGQRRTSSGWFHLDLGDRLEACPIWLRCVALWIVAASLIGCATVSEKPVAVGPVPEAVRAELKLAPFYQKFVAAGPLPIVASAEVDDHALLEARWLILKMMEGREDLLSVMASNKLRFAIMAHDEFTTDLPEQARMMPKAFWDRRARGLGASPQIPVVSCGEENLLCFPGDQYAKENILIHEFAHAIQGFGLDTVDPTFSKRLQAAYDDAQKNGRYVGFYAGSNSYEYWAEAVQSWFGNNRENDPYHNHVNTRAELKAYDPALAALCEEVFGPREWTYLKPMDRPESERAHLRGYDFSKSPTFAWPEAIKDATKNVPDPKEE
jgi:hypothetical protein